MIILHKCQQIFLKIEMICLDNLYYAFINTYLIKLILFCCFSVESYMY
jgi:hypothetical protein